MIDDHPTNFPETVIASVHAAVASTLTCEALPVRGALRLLLSGQHTPIRALVTCSLYPAQPGIDAGTALDLIHISLQQLHAHIDATSGASALLGNAAADVPEHLWNIGIRIEDDAVVTAKGCELITADVPKTIADIEALMRETPHV